ncbi:glycosyltransferase family 4 protein [Candidatus Thioglobus sp.]|nr:glycosyltransferase family 4 protein [Candidatus Thioglobus sp.]
MNRILFVNLVTYSQAGGIENYNKNIINSLSKIVTSDVVSIYDSEYKCVDNIKFFNFNKSRLRASFFILKNIYKYDKILASHINIMPVLIIAKILNPRVAVLLSAHGIEVWKSFNFIYKYFLSIFTILPVSNYTIEVMIKKNSLKKNNFKLLHNCVDMDQKNNFHNLYDVSEFNILTVSRLNRSDNYKGIDFMIKVIPLLVKKIPNIKYTIIGEGDDREYLENLAKELNVSKYVDFKGFVECVEVYYKYCDIFSLPSVGEGFGIVYIEAMKYKRPCIACTEGGQTDVVLDNKTGFLCEYGNIESLYDAIYKLSESEYLRKRYGENGFTYLKENFTFKKFTKRLQNILDEE